MFQRCLVCGTAFKSNHILEHLDRGRRIAYDIDRGRVWIVCPSCRRWSLLPIESRWEALEELEKLVVDKGRLLASTDHICLYRAEALEIVRIGSADFGEEAWWRYGRMLRGRRDHFKRLSAAGVLGAFGVIAGSAVAGSISFVTCWIALRAAPEVVTGGARWLRFGSTAWRGETRCGRCGEIIEGLRFSRRNDLVLESVGDGQITVRVPCITCGHRQGRVTLSDDEARALLRRVLAYHHFSGASAGRVEGATRLIEVAGGPQHLASTILRRPMHLGRVGRVGGVALEMALHEDNERALLAMEVAEIEAHWRREEELARIIDQELSPPHGPKDTLTP